MRFLAGCFNLIKTDMHLSPNQVFVHARVYLSGSCSCGERWSAPSRVVEALEIKRAAADNALSYAGQPQATRSSSLL